MPDNTPTWKSQTCESCEFRVDGLCRESPPSIGTETTEVSLYPLIKIGDDIFSEACSRWKPRK